jgi:hypothetical protein
VETTDHTEGPTRSEEHPIAMTKTITGTLHFYDNEPHVVGTLIIDGEHYELAGVRHSKIRASFKARKNKRESATQGDLFNASGGSGERKQHSP